ncbi:MAG: hypothetical protein LBL48_03860 [Azoarcus sp.]|jgi:hypothetical protein|nr:hypothetical protein [Azoarcus sp.]
MTDPVKYRREFSRWIILVTLNNSRPLGTSETNVLTVVRAEFPDMGRDELRRELDYLKDRYLVAIKPPPDGSPWHCDLTRHGVDIVEYTVDVHPGIARPEKYW